MTSIQWSLVAVIRALRDTSAASRQQSEAAVAMGMMQSVSASFQHSLAFKSAEKFQPQRILTKEDLIVGVKHTETKSKMGTMARAALRRWAYNLSGFNRYGLHHDDCLDVANPDVAEAVRRLPQDVQDVRNYRLIRAMHVSMLKTYLPEKEWVRYDEDDRYLEPYLQEVIRERQEREKWNKEH